MSFPGLAAAPEETKASDQPQEDGEAAAEEIDDGFTPEQRRKNALEQDPSFKKFLMMYRMKIPLVNIRNKLKADPSSGYTPADIDLFATQQEKEDADYSLNVM